MAGYIYVGKRIYYLKENGNIILDTGEAEGWVNKTTVEQDFKIYTELQKYTKDSVDCIELQFGEFKTEFSECTSYKVDVNKKELVFDYSEIPPSPDVPASPTLHERVVSLEQEKKDLEDVVFEQGYEISLLKAGVQI